MSKSYPSGSLDSYPPDTTANIAAFVQRVKQIAPDIRKVEVWSLSDTEELVKQHDIHAVDLIQQLYGIVETRTAITGNCLLLVEYLDLEPIRNLVHVDYRIEATSSRIMPLICRSAQTLQSLELFGIAHVDYTELIRDPDSDGRWLKRVEMRWAYPFGDDVLFRGNAATLECLDIVLNSEMVAMLRQRNVFTPTSHPKLKCVNINSRFSDAPSAFAAAPEYLQF
ncbi:hypothetical protein IWW47_001251, partial [Coemansia sp. RSA 2052]